MRYIRGDQMNNVCELSFFELFIYCLLILCASMAFWIMVADYSSVKAEIKTEMRGDKWNY